MSPSVLVHEHDDVVDLVVRLSAPGGGRVPRRFVAVVDGSQAGWDAVRRACVRLADALPADDELAVVLVAYGVARLWRPMAPNGGRGALEAFGGISVGGRGNLAAGLARGVQEGRHVRRSAWSAAWARAHARTPSASVAALLGRLGGEDLGPEAPPEATVARAATGVEADLDADALRLLAAAQPVEVLLVADGDAGRGERDGGTLARYAAFGRRWGVWVHAVGVGRTEGEWGERLFLIGVAGGDEPEAPVGDPGAEGLQRSLARAVGDDRGPASLPTDVRVRAAVLRLRLSPRVLGVLIGGRYHRNDVDDGVVLDLGDLRSGEASEYLMRLTVESGGPRDLDGEPGPDPEHDDAPGAPERDDRAEGPPPDGAGPLGELDIEWFDAVGHALEGVSVTLPAGAARAGDDAASWSTLVGAPWREPLPDEDPAWSDALARALRDARASSRDGDGDPEEDDADHGDLDPGEASGPGGLDLHPDPARIPVDPVDPGGLEEDEDDIDPDDEVHDL